MKIGAPLIINLACTGVVPIRAMSPHVPLSHSEIVDNVAVCLESGVQMVHLHARDAQGCPTGDPEPYGRLIEAIRALPGGRQAVIGVTTSGRQDASFAVRSQVLDLDGDMQPDMGSLTLSSLNFAQSASVNAPNVIRALAGRMLERGIRPELEVFDSGMANFAKVLLKEGVIKPPLYVNVLLGNVSGSQADLLQLAAILAALPEECTVCVAGLGRFQLLANGLGILGTDGVRVGLEDNLWLDQARTTPATNLALVQRVIAQAALFERSLMPLMELRSRLGMSA
ncbi:MAG: 3-keto-5-aminohexanoate cleavage protein [Methylococcaceae bacterium]